MLIRKLKISLLAGDVSFFTLSTLLIYRQIQEWIFGLWGLWLFFYYALRLYDLPILQDKPALQENLIKAAALNFLFTLAIAKLTPLTAKPLMLVWFWGFVLSWLIRGLLSLWLKKTKDSRPTKIPLKTARAQGAKSLITQIKAQDTLIYQALKRALDLAVAILIGLLFAPLALLAALAIKLEDNGPLFFKQNRVGYQGKLFKFIKFRTMTPEASQKGLKNQITAQENDPRITRVGSILRRTHLDEYPQLWNVLRGEMSFVGPRPEQPKIARFLEKKEPLYKLRYLAKPGMTGWATLDYVYAHTLEEHWRKLEYDLYYLTHRNIWFDLAITIKTPSYMFGRQGR